MVGACFALPAGMPQLPQVEWNWLNRPCRCASFSPSNGKKMRAYASNPLGSMAMAAGQ